MREPFAHICQYPGCILIVGRSNPVMQQLKSEIEYNFEEIDRGAAVRISTKNPTALKAIHDFLRFQIKEHKTGDSLDVGKQGH